MAMRPMYGAMGKAVGATSLAFMSQAAIEKGKPKEYGLEKEAVAIRGCRTVTKKVSVRTSIILPPALRILSLFEGSGRVRKAGKIHSHDCKLERLKRNARF